MSSPDELLKMLRSGSVVQREAIRQFGIYRLNVAKRELAGRGHIIRTVPVPDGLIYELAKDADADRLWEGGEAA